MSANLDFQVFRHSLVSLACRSGYLRRLRDNSAIRSWQRAGKPVPPPSIVKQTLMRSYALAFGVSTFVETGTYLGDMDYALRDQFKAIYSIELSEALWKRAVRRFRAYPHIQIRLGDSGDVLPRILENIASPTIFWLDGHYSGGVTAKGCLETPVVKEVIAILRHKVKAHIILIDDARCFDGTGDYPTQNELKDLVAQNSLDFTFMISNDVIRIHPNRTVRCEF